MNDPFTVQAASKNTIPAVFTLDPPTVIKGRRYTLPANKELVFRGGSVPRHRRQFVITNYGNVAPATGTNSLQLRTESTGDFTTASEPDAGFAILVFGSTSITLFTNADITIRNPNDLVSVSFTVCEIFYS